MPVTPPEILVYRSASNRPHELPGAVGKSFFERTQILQARHPARCNHRHIGCLGQRECCSHVQARQHAISFDVGVDNSANGQPASPLGKFDRPGIHVSIPAFGRQPTVASVQTENHLSGVAGRSLFEKLGLAHRPSTENDLRHTGIHADTGPRREDEAIQRAGGRHERRLRVLGVQPRLHRMPVRRG